MNVINGGRALEMRWILSEKADYWGDQKIIL